MRKQQGTANLGAHPEFVRLAQKAPYAQAFVPLPASLSPLLVAWEPFLLRHAELEGRRKEFPAIWLRSPWGHVNNLVMPKKYSGSERKTRIIFFFFLNHFSSPSQHKSWQKLTTATKDRAATLPAPSLVPLKWLQAWWDLPEGMSEERWISVVVIPHLWLSHLQYCIYFWRETRRVSLTTSLYLTHVHYLNLRSAPTRESSKYDFAQVLKN